MRLLDLSFDSPPVNLALDEALLDAVEEGRSPETLRLWESPRLFVVLGVSQALREHVFERACEEDDVSIQRRCSAGGCVLQGPGCLNFSLALRQDGHPELRTIRGSYCHILDRIVEALRIRGVTVRHKGISDLAVGGKKISGNAQRRRRAALLHHGTLLYAMEEPLMTRYIIEPSERPQYRGERTHRGFVQNLPLPAQELRAALIEAFAPGATPGRADTWELEEARKRAKEKYASEAWIRRR